MTTDSTAQASRVTIYLGADTGLDYIENNVVCETFYPDIKLGYIELPFFLENGIKIKMPDTGKEYYLFTNKDYLLTETPTTPIVLKNNYMEVDISKGSYLKKKGRLGKPIPYDQEFQIQISQKILIASGTILQEVNNLKRWMILGSDYTEVLIAQ